MPDERDKPATKADITTLGNKIDGLENKIDGLENKIDGLENRMDGLEPRIDSLDNKIDRVAAELVNTQADVREIKHDMTTKLATKDDIGRILNAIDAFAKKSENNDKSVALHGHVLTEVQVGLKDHEKRLETLESAHP